MIRPNDEHWQSNLQGTLYTTRLDRLIHERARQETARYLLAEAQRTGQLHARMHETVALSILNSKGKIESVGINKPDDLILNNYGVLLALISHTITSQAGANMTDVTNTARLVYAYAGTPLIFNETTDLGTLLKVGSGTTTATRADYDIETPFGTAPENTYFATTNGSYAAGHVSFSGTITAGGSGTINEVGYFGYFGFATNYAYFMLFHDNLETPQAFTAGQTINVSYSIDI